MEIWQVEILFVHLQNYIGEKNNLNNNIIWIFTRNRGQNS